MASGFFPVVDTEVRDVPARRGAAAAPAPGLVKSEQPGAMEVVDRLLRHLAHGFGRIGPLAQHRHQSARAAHRLVVAHLREAAPAARRAHARIPATWGIRE